MAPKKGDKGSKKGKEEEPKKAGKEDKKGDKKGKKEEPPAKGKGKDDGKKGKGKKPISESEASEEEDEGMSSERTEEEESEEEVVTKKGAKGKGKVALKGASTAMKGFSKAPGKRQPKSEDEDEEEETPKLKKGMAAMNLKKMNDAQKGASKAVMGLAGQGQKKGMAVQMPAIKGASSALSGITGKSSLFSMPKPAEKAKPKRNLKSTTRLFLRISKKKKPPGSKPLLGGTKLFAGFGGKDKSGDKKGGLSGFSNFGGFKKDNPSKKTLNLSGLGGQAASSRRSTPALCPTSQFWWQKTSICLDKSQLLSTAFPKKAKPYAYDGETIITSSGLPPSIPSPTRLPLSISYV
ncbi:unnamed protein product [Arctogadus glacialis]